MIRLKTNRYTLLCCLLTALVLAGCATGGKSDGKTVSAEKMYQEARQSMDKGDFKDAIDRYEKLEVQYPFGPYTQQAQLDIAYAYYRYNEADSAIAAAERFIKLNPRHPQVDYAYYLRGLADFDRTRSSFDKWTKIDSAKRDPHSARQSYDNFAELIKRFPQSKYRADALQRMVYLRNYLARHELYVADYYLRRGAYVAAADRASFIIETYPRTPSVASALPILAEAYRKLGLDDLYQDTQRVIHQQSSTTGDQRPG